MGMLNYPKSQILGMRIYPFYDSQEERMKGIEKGDINETFEKCSFMLKFKEGDPPEVD